MFVTDGVWTSQCLVPLFLCHGKAENLCIQFLITSI